MSERIPVEMSGTKSVTFSLNPEEFRGKSLKTITTEVMKVAGEIDPAVSFVEDDAVLVAWSIQSAIGPARDAGS